MPASDPSWVDIVIPAPATTGLPVSQFLLLSLLAVIVFLVAAHRFLPAPLHALWRLRRIKRRWRRRAIPARKVLFELAAVIQAAWSVNRIEDIPIPEKSRGAWHAFCGTLREARFAPADPDMRMVESLLHEAAAWIRRIPPSRWWHVR